VEGSVYGKLPTGGLTAIDIINDNLITGAFSILPDHRCTSS